MHAWRRSRAITATSIRRPSRRMCGGDKTVQVWSVATGRCLRTLEGHKDSVHLAAFSVDGQRVESASKDSTIKLWNALTGSHLRTFYSHDTLVTSAAFSEDGKWVISASIDGIVKIWETSSGDCRGTSEVEKASYVLHSPVMVSQLFPDFHMYTTRPTQQQDYDISDDHAWVLNQRKPVLWLPLEYRPLCSAAAVVEGGTNLALGSESGRLHVIFFPSSSA